MREYTRNNVYSYGERHGAPWEMRESADVKAMYLSRTPTSQICRRTGRTVGSITSRLTLTFDDDAVYEWARTDPKYSDLCRETRNFYTSVQQESPQVIIEESTKIRSSDARLLHIVALLQSGYTTCNVCFPNSGRQYTYRVPLSMGVKDNDLVVVPVHADDTSELKFGKVVVVHDEPNIDVTAPFALKWVVARVDLEQYNTQVARERDALNELKRQERARAKADAIAELTKILDVDAIKAILIGGGGDAQQ